VCVLRQWETALMEEERRRRWVYEYEYRRGR
jgi:hypothetical protein